MREPKLGHFVFRFGYFAKNCKLLGESLLQRVQIDQKWPEVYWIFKYVYMVEPATTPAPVWYHVHCQSSLKYLRKAKGHNVKLLR